MDWQILIAAKRPLLISLCPCECCNAVSQVKSIDEKIRKRDSEFLKKMEKKTNELFETAKAANETTASYSACNDEAKEYYANEFRTKMLVRLVHKAIDNGLKLNAKQMTI